MKKFLAIILGALFVMSFAASAFAIHAEIPSETTAMVAKGATQITLGGQYRVRGWWKDNIDLANNPVDAASQAFYDQRIRLSIDAKVASNVQGFLQFESGLGTVDTWTWGNFNSKPATISILESWILYTGNGLLGIPAGLKVGHMPLALGHKVFFDHTKYGDDAIVFFMDPVKGLHIGLLTIKFGGDATPAAKATSGDDLDGYVALVTYKLDNNHTLGANYTYLNQSNADFTHQNLGLHANGNIAGLGYKAEADIQFGDLNETTEFKGYAVMAAVNYRLDPANLRAMVGYGTGQDDDSDVKIFTPYLSNDRYNTFVYDYSINGTSGAKNMGLANTTIFNIGADFTPVKDLTASIDGYLIRASEENATGSNEAGWEVDGQIKYSLAKNLTYEVNAGYFKAGDFYGDDNKGAVVVNNVLTLSF